MSHVTTEYERSQQQLNFLLTCFGFFQLYVIVNLIIMRISSIQYDYDMKYLSSDLWLFGIFLLDILLTSNGFIRLIRKTDYNYYYILVLAGLRYIPVMVIIVIPFYAGTYDQVYRSSFLGDFYLYLAVGALILTVIPYIFISSTALYCLRHRPKTENKFQGNNESPLPR